MQWRVWLSYETKIKFHTVGHTGNIISGFQFNYELLLGEGTYSYIAGRQLYAVVF